MSESNAQVPTKSASSKKNAKKKGKNTKVNEAGDLPPVTDGTDESKLNGSVAEEQPSTSGTSKPVAAAAASSTAVSLKSIEQFVAQATEQKKKEEDLRKALEIMKLAQQAGLGPGALSSGPPLAAQPKTAEEAKKKKYEFWETQPVPQMHEEVPFHVEINEPIDPNTDVDKVRKEPLTLPDGFVWVSMDVDNDSDLNELFTLLFENYVEDDDNMFRFNYSHEFLRWVLKPPGYNTDWFCGVRVGPKPGATKLGKLVGFVSAIPAKVRVYDQILRAVEINFLCVHKKLRAKRMAPVLIKEITRRVNLTGIWQALYTAGVFVPKPVSTCRYFHRSLNPKKLIDVGFSSLTKNMNMSRTVKLYRLPEQAQLEGLRQMDPAKDMPQVFQLITDHMGKFDLVPQFNLEELTHWLSPVPNVIDTYVVERLSNPELKNSKKEIVAFFSFYILPSTVMNHKVHKDVKAAYSFYNVVASDKLTLTDLMNDALIVAKNSGMDVFNALNQMENDEFLTKLKFGSGDGSLHYYLFNWKCPPFKPSKIGVVLQ